MEEIKAYKASNGTIFITKEAAERCELHLTLCKLLGPEPLRMIGGFSIEQIAMSLTNNPCAWLKILGQHQ